MAAPAHENVGHKEQDAKEDHMIQGQFRPADFHHLLHQGRGPHVDSVAAAVEDVVFRQEQEKGQQDRQDKRKFHAAVDVRFQEETVIPHNGGIQRGPNEGNRHGQGELPQGMAHDGCRRGLPALDVFPQPQDDAEGQDGENCRGRQG